VDLTLSHHNLSDIKAIEQKARKEHKEAEQARTLIHDVLIQKRFHENRPSNHQEKNK